MADDIEDRIMSDVAANTGDDFSAEPSSNEPDDTHSAEPNNDGREPPVQGDKRRKQDNEQGKPTKDSKQPEPKQSGPKRDDKGNIVDDKGNIVAARGVERRLHHQNERLKDYNKTLTTELNQLRQQVQQSNALGGLPKQYGLDNNDVSEAFKIAGTMKRDPVMGARMALEFALSQGAELSQIVQAEGLQNISLGAQRRMMEEMHRRTNGPIEQERQQRANEQKAHGDALRFMTQYPESEEHFDDIGRMVPEIIKRGAAEGRNIDPYTAGEMALRTLQNFAMQNGLDPNRSIQSQIDERAQAQQQGNRQNVPQNQHRDVRSPSPRQPAPMPNGSRGSNQVPSRSGSLPANTSSDAIVRRAMADNGYTFGN